MPLRLIDTQRVKAQFQFEKRDLWIGFFWRVLRQVPAPLYTLHLCVCFIPMLPLHVTVLLRGREKEAKPESV